MFAGKTLPITGGTGTFGNAVFSGILESAMQQRCF